MQLKTIRTTFVIVIILISISIFNSCIPQKKIRLIQTKAKNDTINEFVLKQRPKSTVLPFDNLYIKVISPDAATSAMFNSETTNQRNVDYNMISYTVNDSGYIVFPFVGLIKVKDLTILAAQDTIQAAISKYISDASVLVKFVGKSVTIIGEVNRQGEYQIYSDNINIFKGLAMAGGLTNYGNRENITIIREIDGKSTFHTINLTDKYVLQSDFYYLRPEDVVLIQPLKQKSWGFSEFPYSLVLSGLTTLVTLLTFMKIY
ncbi:MAG: polysaccharide biosynthesis/export family protein [Bacteroidales bacterium]|nr:polysaccharide biosynthesis/export family protein [Bacteroidales bacterium]